MKLQPSLATTNEAVLKTKKGTKFCQYSEHFTKAINKQETLEKDL